MKYVKISFVILMLTAVFSPHIGAVTEYILSGYVFCNGGSIQYGNNLQLVGTFGQPVVGKTQSTFFSSNTGFGYFSRDYIEGVFVEDDALPEQFGLLGNFPNPFNPTTEIRYELPEQCHVKISIYSVSGQCVETLTDEVMPAGFHAVRWTPKRFASGLYFYSLEAGSKKFVSKMLLLK